MQLPDIKDHPPTAEYFRIQVDVFGSKIITFEGLPVET